MPMTKGEIVTSYRQAKDQRSQIKVLAELNVTSQEEIIKILQEAGETVQDSKPKPKPQTKAAQKTKVAEKKPEWEEWNCVKLTPSEAETLADYIGLTLLPSIRTEKWGIENPEYIGDLSSVYAKCLKLVERTGRSTFSGTFQSERRGMYGKDVWEDDAADKME